MEKEANYIETVEKEANYIETVEKEANYIETVEKEDETVGKEADCWLKLLFRIVKLTRMTSIVLFMDTLTI